LSELNLSERLKSDARYALRQFSLLTDDNTPTDLFRSLVTADEDKEREIWWSILQNSYYWLVGVGNTFDAETFTQEELRERFVQLGYSDGFMLKMERLFLNVATLAGVAPAWASNRRRTGKRRNSVNSRTRTKSELAVVGGRGVQALAPPEPTLKDKLLERVVNSTPPFKDEWDLDKQMAWYEQQRWLITELTDKPTAMAQLVAKADGTEPG